MSLEVENLRREVHALREAVDRLAGHVTHMTQSWPALMRDIAGHGSQQKEHERRIIQLEGFAQRAAGGSTPPSGFRSPVSIGKHRLDPTQSGLHYVDENMVSGARRLVPANVLEKTYEEVVKRHDEAEELGTWRWIKGAFRKSAGHLLTFALTAAGAYLWHRLTSP